MSKQHNIICNICGMEYVSELQDNVRQHNEYLDKTVNGLRTSPMKSDCIISSQDDKRITVISQLSPMEQLKLAEEVAQYARKDTPYGAEQLFDDKVEVRVFLLYKKDRIIGLLLVDKRYYVWLARWDELDVGKKPKKIPHHPPIWTVCFVWILKKHRAQNLAKILLNEAITYLGCRLDQIGWYTPFTDSGQSFVKSYCPEEFYIAQ
jgi:GNAT superfamily N-acetyltransferase